MLNPLDFQDFSGQAGRLPHRKIALVGRAEEPVLAILAKGLILNN